MENKLITTAAFLFNGVAYGLLIWLLKRWMTRIETGLELASKNYNKCHAELPEKYASKPTHERLWARVDGISTDVANLRGRMNGGAH